MCDLTERQLEIVQHLCNGLSIEEAANAMFISRATAQAHLKAAKKAAGAVTTTHLASIVIASGKLYWTPEGRSLTPERERAPNP